MTERERMSDQGACGDDAAAYVLGALNHEESEAFRRHLAGCIVCRDEVVALESVADSLALTAPQLSAPASLRRRVLARAREDLRAQNADALGRGSPRARLRWPGLGRLALGRPAFAAATLLAAVVLGAVGLELGSGATNPARLVPASVSVPGASAVLRLAGGHAELTLRHMPAPPQGHIYEVWLKRDGQPPTATNALFSVTSAGTGTVAVPDRLQGVSQVLVTRETDGGSLVPTHDPVVIARVPRE